MRFLDNNYYEKITVIQTDDHARRVVFVSASAVVQAFILFPDIDHIR